MADFNHFRQRAGTGQRNDLGVIGIFLNGYLFHRNSRVLFLEFFDQFRNNCLTLLFYRRVHKLNCDLRCFIVLTA
ncbi:Uncharacterised protein [Enterobacter cloacae]|nr:Uncharacterised protein [Enterobacter cloacae]